MAVYTGDPRYSTGTTAAGTGDSDPEITTTIYVVIASGTTTTADSTHDFEEAFFRSMAAVAVDEFLDKECEPEPRPAVPHGVIPDHARRDREPKPRRATRYRAEWARPPPAVAMPARCVEMIVPGGMFLHSTTNGESMSDITRFPLSWPAGRPRTAAHKRSRPKFTAPTFARARDDLLAELRRLGAAQIVLSTNVELRQDGLPYSGRRNPDDPGAAVYFVRKGNNLAFACDRWISVEENLRAITDAIECIRTIERRGTGEMVDAAFTGFQQLSAASKSRGWWLVLCVQAHESTANVENAYRLLAKQFHPDRNPGDAAALEKYHEVQAAYEQFKTERGL